MSVFWAGLGILASRVTGLLREKFLALYLGAGVESDALRAALRLPNLLQNLFGEGALSASFIPVYVRRRAANEAEAAALAQVLFWILTAAVTLICAAGVLATPWLVGMIAGGLSPEARGLAVVYTRWIFPATGCLVLSAWCLAILNSHRRFFLSYVAPTVWNFSIVIMLVAGAQFSPSGSWGFWAALGVLVGSVLQFAIQLPDVYPLIRGGTSNAFITVDLREVAAQFIPSVFSRGVVQISAYVDTYLATQLASGALTCLSAAQALYILPISLFGLSTAAVQLPDLSISSRNSLNPRVPIRLLRSLRRMLIWVLPSVAGLFFLAPQIVALLYEGGAWTEEATGTAAATLQAFSGVVLFSTVSRLWVSWAYSRGGARQALGWSGLRVVISGALGWWWSQTDILALTHPVAGLGWAATAGAAVECAIYLGNSRWPSRWREWLLRSTLPMAIAAGLSAWVSATASRFLCASWRSETPGQLWSLLFIALYLMLLVGLVLLLPNHRKSALNLVNKRFSRKP